MMRDIVRIDRDKCDGCGACAKACSEGAIELIDGKAVLVREDCCDGLGACLPVCPAGAIAIEKRETPAFQDQIVMAGCPGTRPAEIKSGAGELTNWPVKIRLAPVSSPYFRNCDLLLAADCSAFARGSFHEDFIKGKKVLIGCPKLDPEDCWDKVKEIIRNNGVGSITAVRMEVPCCSLLEKIAEDCGIPAETITLRTDGSVLKKREWWTGRDLNARLLACKASDLPADLPAH